MEALIDVLLYVIIIGAAIIVVSGLGCAIVGMAHRIGRTGRRVENSRKYIRRRIGRNDLQPVYMVSQRHEKPHLP